MATDLYARLQELKKHQRSHALPPDAAAPKTAPQAVTGHSPGSGWERIAPGVYERSQVYSMGDRSLPFELDDGGRWYRFPPLLGPYSGTRPLFLDVETSGLSGGAGSTAFLIGVGVFSGGAEREATLTVYQLFLSEPAGEAALLSRFGELVGDPAHTCYVTYNGAGFDLPVLRTRHILNRTWMPEANHWDLMPLTRRLYAPAIGSCSLGRVERLVLGLSRDDDVPGSEVPSRYHRFLEHGDPEEIAPVVAHHYYDVAHLALLAARLHEIVDQGRDGVGGAAYDRVGLAKLLLHRGGAAVLPRCAAVLDEVIEETEQRRRHVAAAARAGGFASRMTSRPPRAWSESRELRAVVARRLGQWEVLREVRWSVWNVRGSQRDAVELAKVLEHRFRDYSGARSVLEEWAQRAGESDAAIMHRMERLRRKGNHSSRRS
ncbi:MAG: ribonuclease H-like domain-containing protein [Alkalispirochaeta sp.]